MKRKSLAVLFILLISQLISVSSANAVSTYDDFFEEQGTTSLRNHVENYYGKTCGSPVDDYAMTWSSAMHTNNVYSSDPAHGIAMASFDNAVANGGGWIVTYDQVNNGDNSSNPYFINVYWAEDASQWEQIFYSGPLGDQYFALQRKAGVPESAVLYQGYIGSSLLVQGVGGCEVEWLFGGMNYYTGGLSLWRGGPTKLFLSTFSNAQEFANVYVPSTYNPANHTYVAMGDSFSSGEGNPDFETGSDQDGVNECHRSPTAYPRILQSDPNLHLGPADFVACSGATTYNVLHGGSAGGSWGEGPQIDALTTNTKVVTLTIGGNDVGFKDFATACTLTTCNFSTAAYSDIQSKIANDLPSKLADVYAAIDSETSSTAKIYVIGYPQIAPAEMPSGSSSFCTPLNGQNDTNDPTQNDGATAYAVVDQLNTAIHDAVDDYGSLKFTYVDPNESNSPFIGHDWCEQDRYFDIVAFNQQEYSFHPNAAGHRAYAAVVKPKL